MSHHQLKITGQVFGLFNQVQKLMNVNKAIIFQLIKIFLDDAEAFSQALEQAYLKIFKSCLPKANKKIPAKFETLIQSFFREILKFENQNWQRDKTMKDGIKLLNNFLQFCIEAIYSSTMNIRIMAARITFLLVKLIPQQILHKILTPQIQNQFTSSILHLLRLRVSTYRQLGAKLSSMVQHLPIDKVRQIQKELFKIASLDENEQIRKMVITNIIINKGNIDRILIRLRDKTPEIRSIIIKKLQSEKYTFSSNKFQLSQIYKLLYDAYGSKQILVKKECINYFIMFFDPQGFQSNTKDRKSTLNKTYMDLEIPKQNQYQNTAKNKQRFLKFYQFVSIFQPNILIINPHLYTLFDALIREILEELPSQLVSLYIKSLCLKIKNCFNNPIEFEKNDYRKLSMEIIWLKHSINTPIKQLSIMFEQFCPTGTQLGKILLLLVEQEQLYGTYQLLQYFQKQTHQIPDQIGRNKMFDSLKTVLYNLKFFSPIYSPEVLLKGNTQHKQPNINRDILSNEDDICTIPSTDQLITQKLMLSYYNLPIISCSLDLIEMIPPVMKALRPEYYQIEMKEIMAEWNNPEENTSFKEREVILANIAKVEQSTNYKNEAILNTLYTKLNQTEFKIEQNKQKTRLMVISICKLKVGSDIQMYMPVIKQHLNQSDQSQGLILLGFYCLDKEERVKNFLPVYWHHLTKHNIKNNIDKSHLMVSLKVVADFIIKFNILKNRIEIVTDNQNQSYNSDLFMENLFNLMLHYDADVRILAIQCLCRIMYHDKVEQTHTSISMIYLLLLWWSTDSQAIAAKSVHTISIFVKCYVDENSGKEGNRSKLAQAFCIFFKLLMKYYKEGKTINKNKVTYNLKLDQFMRKAISIAITVLKFGPKEKGMMKAVVENGDLLKQQQLFILFLLQEDGFQNILDKTLQNCDFYQSSELETLLLVKNKIQKINNSSKINRKNQATFRKFEQEIDQQINLKNGQTYNHEQFNIIQNQLNQNIKIFDQETKRIAKNIQKQQIFIKKTQEDEQLQNQKNSQIYQYENQNSQDNVQDKSQQVNIKKNYTINYESQLNYIDKGNQKMNSSQIISLIQDQKSKNFFKNLVKVEKEQLQSKKVKRGLEKRKKLQLSQDSISKSQQRNINKNQQQVNRKRRANSSQKSSDIQVSSIPPQNKTKINVRRVKNSNKEKKFNQEIDNKRNGKKIQIQLIDSSQRDSQRQNSEQLLEDKNKVEIKNEVKKQLNQKKKKKRKLIDIL